MCHCDFEFTCHDNLNTLLSHTRTQCDYRCCQTLLMDIYLLLPLPLLLHVFQALLRGKIHVEFYRVEHQEWKDTSYVCGVMCNVCNAQIAHKTIVPFKFFATQTFIRDTQLTRYHEFILFGKQAVNKSIQDRQR